MSETLGREPVRSKGGFSRRKMVGFLIAGPTLVAGASLRSPAQAEAAGLPTINPADAYDLSDLLRTAAQATMVLITVKMNGDGTASFELPRSENGQGITTAAAMVIADELDIAVEKVKVTLAPARPELQFNQFTAGSVSMFELFEPMRTAAALAKQQMLRAAARELGVARRSLSVADGVVTGGGRSLTYGELAEYAAVSRSRREKVTVELKQRADLKFIGTEQKRLDALASVTGAKQFAMDLKVPDALPVVICRAPTINGNAEELLNEAEVRAMPGVTDVLIVPNTNRGNNEDGILVGGVAIRARTFGQCIDAVNACKVRWSDGTAAGKSADTVKADLQAAELPMTPALPGEVTEETFTFHFRPGDPLETNNAVAHVRADGADIWGALKSPIWAKGRIAAHLNLPQESVNVHVVEGGGSFGRKLFCDAAFEAAHVSRAMGNKPVRLMWTRADGPRQGRCHPMALSRVRIVHSGEQVLALDQRHTSVQTDFTQGLGDALTAAESTLPLQNFLQFSQAVFELTATVPYNFGPTTQLLNEVYSYNTFNTSSVRNIYSPEVRTSIELLVDQVAAKMGKDPLEFRLQFQRDERMKAVLEKVKEAAGWGRALPAGVAQGVGVHNEYKGFAACVVEIDTRPKTVNRKVTGGVTGPRVTRATFVVDVGLPINPLGLKAQMMGGIMDGIGQVLTYGLHLKDGAFLEASWDNAFYTRQWNVPRKLDVIVLPPTTGQPGGAGELGVAASMAATACAYARATGSMPTEFPVNYNQLGFKPYPFVPPVPKSPKNGLTYRNAPKQRV